MVPSVWENSVQWPRRLGFFVKWKEGLFCTWRVVFLVIKDKVKTMSYKSESKSILIMCSNISRHFCKAADITWTLKKQLKAVHYTSYWITVILVHPHCGMFRGFGSSKKVNFFCFVLCWEEKIRTSNLYILIHSGFRFKSHYYHFWKSTFHILTSETPRDHLSSISYAESRRF